MLSGLPTVRHTLWKDHFRYSVVAVGPDADGNAEHSTDDDDAHYVFPPTDGILRWRLPRSVEIIPGKEAGDLDVDVAWLDAEPEGVYERAGVASACDLQTPTGTIHLVDGAGSTVARHRFPAASRCRVFVEVEGRDASAAPGVRWGQKTDEVHTIVVWPTSRATPPWTSPRLDRTAHQALDDLRAVGIDPVRGQREP
ncbi:hypothetical protein [Jatrophihabitans fulvus]